MDVGDLIRLEFEAIGAPEGDRVGLSGPPVPLDFDVVQTVGLAVHELVTNAIKHGALSKASGSLSVSWKVGSNPKHGRLLVLDWREAGISIINAPDRKGFGRELIERALTSSLGAKTDLSFTPDGLTCHIELPLSSKAGTSERQ